MSKKSEEAKKRLTIKEDLTLEEKAWFDLALAFDDLEPSEYEDESIELIENGWYKWKPGIEMRKERRRASAYLWTCLNYYVNLRERAEESKNENL